MNKLRNSAGSNKISVNKEVSDMVFGILNALKKRPENKGKDEFEVLKTFLDYYSIDGNHSLLEEMSKTGNINFDMIQDDGFDIGEIIGEDKNTSSSTLHNILNNPSLGSIGKDIEKIVVSELIKKIRSKVPGKLQTHFDEEIQNPRSLNELKNQIWNFFEYGGLDEKTKNEIGKIKITNKNIVDGLVKNGKLQKNDIDGNYKNRNTTYKKSFDKIISQEYLGGLRNSTNYIEKNFNTLKDTFTDFIPNMSWIFDKYPYDRKEIAKNNPKLLQKIDELEEKLSLGEDIRDERHRNCFFAYVSIVQDKNKKLGDILSKLFQNQFDFSTLDRNEQNQFLSETVGSRLSELKKHGIANLLNIDQNKFDEFMRDIFDLNKKEIVIPCAGGDITLGVSKNFKGGKNPDFADINNFAENKLPLIFDIQILGENKDLINNSALKQVFEKEISADGNSIHLDGNSIGKLILMYALGEGSFDKKEMSEKKIDKLGNIFDLIDKKNNLNNKDIIEPDRNVLISDKSKEDNELLKRQRHYTATREEIKKNLKMEDDERIGKSKEKLNLEGKEYNDTEEVFSLNNPKGKAVLEAHYSTVYNTIDDVPIALKNKVKLINGKYYEIGKDGKRVAGAGNYTDEQLKKKIKILKESGFNSRQNKILLQDGFCGIDSDDLIIQDDENVEDIEKIKDKKALLDARERFKQEQQPVQKSWANFLHYLKEKEGQNVDNYFGYRGNEMEVDGENLIIKGDENNLEEGKNYEGEETQNTHQESVEKQDDPFFTTWKSLKGYEFPEDKEKFGFVVGTRLWIKRADTELPPLDIGGDQWIQLEITSIGDKDFKVKLTGGELSAGGLEGKEIKYPKNKESLENISKAFNGEVYKLPSPSKWNETIEHVKGAGISGIDGISVFDELELKGGKLQSNIIEGNPEITHFGSMETKIDEKTGLENKEIINYKINFNTNGTVDVSYNNYKRTMDYNNFLLFISTKRLKPKTKSEVDEENKSQEKGPTHRSSKWKFFGVANIRHMVQGVGKKVNEGMKKYNEKQDKKFYNVAMGDWKLANKLNSVIGWIPGVGGALEDMNTDFENNKDKETRDKTEEILKKIEGHNDFGAIFTDKTYLNGLLGNGVSLKDMVVSGNLPGGLSGDKRFVASALLLAQINKGPGPYEKIEGLRFKGAWVKLLLGEPYYSKFMEHQKEIIAEMKAKQGLYGPGYDAQLASDLARAEMTFLINNIGGRAPGQRLGNIETGELKSLDGNAKKLRSDKFAGELEGKFNEYMSRTKVEEGADKLANVNNFTFAYIEYRRFLEAGKPTKALPFLKKMAQLAKSPDQIKRFKGAISYGMLTGFFLHHTLPGTQVWIQNICRSFGFSPGLWAPHIDHQRKMAHFFDIAGRDKTGQSNFYKDTGYKLSDFDHVSKFDYKKFIEGTDKGPRGFEKRWDTHADFVDEFLNKGMYKEDMNDPIIKQLQEASMEAQQEDIDQDVSKNSKLISNYPMSLTKGTIGQISRYRDGYFEGKDNDEIQRSQDARSAIAKSIPRGRLEKGRFLYNTKRFLNWFDSKGFDYTGKEEFLKKLATVKKYKSLTANKGFEQKLPDGSSMGEIKQNDVKNLMRYAVNGRIFSSGSSTPPEEYKRAIDSFKDMFWDNLDQIDETFISQTFGSDYSKFFNESKSYKLAPWSHYRRLTKRNSNEITNNAEKSLRQAYKSRQDGGFINYELEGLENDLRRKGGSPSLSELEFQDETFKFVK